MKVAITGAAGYLGRGLVESFAASSHEVLALSRRSCGPGWIPFTLEQDPAALPWTGVDAFVHAAWDFSARSFADQMRMNVEPGIRLFEAAAAAGVKRLMFISSMSAFDGASSHYGRVKLAVEKRVTELGGRVVRPGLVWGCEQGGVMGGLERMIEAFPVVPFPAGGRHAVQYLVHRDDVCSAVVRLVVSGAGDRQVVSFAHPEPWRIDGLLRRLAVRRGKRRWLVPVPWPLVHLGLKASESLRISFPLRSDSLIGLVRGNPHPEIDSNPAGVEARPFA